MTAALFSASSRKKQRISLVSVTSLPAGSISRTIRCAVKVLNVSKCIEISTHCDISSYAMHKKKY